MINKFLQGGKQEEAIRLFIQGLAQALNIDPQLVALIALTNPDIFLDAILVFQLTQDINQAAQTFAQGVQSKVKAARRGAKLQYLKSLKHQCAEDEELYYFKKGGAVNCGCRKKEDGGEIQKALKGSAVDKFKNRHQQIAEEDTIHTKKGIRDLSGKTNYPKFNPKEATSEEKMRAGEKEYFGGRGDFSVGKNYPISERGKKPVVKKSCGSKLKKHLNGGSLNLFFLLK